MHADGQCWRGLRGLQGNSAAPDMRARTHTHTHTHTHARTHTHTHTRARTHTLTRTLQPREQQHAAAAPALLAAHLEPAHHDGHALRPLHPQHHQRQRPVGAALRQVLGGGAEQAHARADLAPPRVLRTDAGACDRVRVGGVRGWPRVLRVGGAVRHGGRGLEARPCRRRRRARQQTTRARRRPAHDARACRWAGRHLCHSRAHSRATDTPGCAAATCAASSAVRCGQSATLSRDSTRCADDSAAAQAASPCAAALRGATPQPLAQAPAPPSQGCCRRAWCVVLRGVCVSV
jgi:hypothetical protein